MRFVFVHGGFHAAWCWERTIDELKRLGHDSIAVDLPGHGVRVDEESTLPGVRRRRCHVVRRLRGRVKYFYHDCDEATARWAFERLGPERFGDTTVTPVSIPRFWAADLPRSFILCLQDRSMPRWLADTVARGLGVEQLTIDTSHSPFLSRPRELAELLVHATTTKPTGPLVPH
jgi:hypothetical protein